MRAFNLPEKPALPPKTASVESRSKVIPSESGEPTITSAVEPQTIVELRFLPEPIREILFDGRLTLEVTPASRGRAVLVARNCSRVLHREELSLNKTSDRAKFVKELTLSDGEQDTVHRTLLSLADRLDKMLETLAGEHREHREHPDDGFSVAQHLIQLAEDGAELFRDPGGECYATVTIQDHRETYKLNSRDFKDWLGGQLYDVANRVASGDKIGEAVAVLRHKAKRAGRFDVHIRVAEHEGAIYLDLVNDTWQQVRVSEDGWEVIEGADSPVRFRRAGGMLALPTPTRDGSLKELRALLNLDDSNQDEWALILGWLVGTFKPCNVSRFAYPLLAVHGEQGSAKSTACRICRRLIDPNKADLRSMPKSEEDLAIAADHGRVLAFDNLTHISDAMSNALCRIATGGGWAGRELYTNEGEVIFESQRPVIINGIAEVVSKSDLLDRSLLIYLPRIRPKKRKLDRDLDFQFAQAQPGILGALLSAVSMGLSELRKGVQLAEPPRLADFAEWVVACESGLGLETGVFLRAYVGNQEKANGLAIEASPVAQAIVAVAEKENEWKGTVNDLLEVLNGQLQAGGGNPKTKHGWPQNARGLSAKVKEVAPNLRRSGVEINFGKRERKGVPLEIKKVPLPSEETNESKQPGKDVHDVHDVHRANTINDLECEHHGEHPVSIQNADVHRERRDDLPIADVHTDVHTVTDSKQRAGEHREHREHLFGTQEIANKSSEDREVLEI